MYVVSKTKGKITQIPTPKLHEVKKIIKEIPLTNALTKNEAWRISKFIYKYIYIYIYISVACDIGPIVN